MDISKVFSARAMSLLAFILVALLVGTMFNVKLGPEPFVEGSKTIYNHPNSGVNNKRNNRPSNEEKAAQQAAKQAAMSAVTGAVGGANNQF